MTSAAEASRRRRGRWREVAALPAAALMIVSSAIPVRAAEPVRLDVAKPPVVTVAKIFQKKKKHKDGNKNESIEDVIEDVFGKHADAALRIAHCESKYRPDAVSHAGAVGVFQIRPRLHGWRVKKVHGKDLRDPRTNIRVAYSLMKDEGWVPWVCARILGITRSRGYAVRYAEASSRGEGAPRVPRQPRMAP